MTVQESNWSFAKSAWHLYVTQKGSEQRRMVNGTSAVCCFIFLSDCEQNELCCANSKMSVHGGFFDWFPSVKKTMYYSSADFMLLWSFTERNKLFVQCLFI